MFDVGNNNGLIYWLKLIIYFMVLIFLEVFLLEGFLMVGFWLIELVSILYCIF